MLHKQTCSTSDCGFYTDNLNIWLCNWAEMNYQSTEIGTYLFSLSNNLNVGNLFLAVSRSLIEFAAMGCTLQQNVIGCRTSASGSSELNPPFPWETIQLWIVFKGQTTLIFLNSSEGKSLQFCKTRSQSEHARECVYVFAERQDKSNIIHNGRVRQRAHQLIGESCGGRASPLKCSKQSNQLLCTEK